MSADDYSKNTVPSFTKLIWSYVALLALNALAFVYHTAAPHIQIDVFRHLEEIVIPLLENRVDLSILWSNHHPSPLLHLIQIANLKYFDFRLDYHAYLGVFFQILTTILIINNVLAQTVGKQHRPGAFVALTAILIVSISLGFNCLDQYTWPLMATVQYLYFIGVALFLAVDRTLRTESRSGYLAVAAISLLFMFANADYATIFLAATVVALLLVYCLERKSIYIRTALIIVIAWSAYRLFMLAILPEGPPRPPNYTLQIIIKLITNPLQTLTQFAIALSSGLIDMTSLKTRFPAAEGFLVFMALLNALLFIGIFITYLKRRLYNISVIPLALMLIAVLLAASVFIYRYWLLDNDIWILAAERYVPSFKLAIIGMLWALCLVVRDWVSQNNEPVKPAVKLVAITFVTILIAIQAIQIIAGWQDAPKIHWSNENDGLGVYLAADAIENSIEVPEHILGHPGDDRTFDSVLTYLKNNRKNVFSENYPKNTLLQQHQASHRLFDAISANVIIDRELGESGQLKDNSGKAIANWKFLPARTVIENLTDTPLQLRYEVSARDYSKPGKFLVLENGDPQPARIALYKGTQNLYFTLERGATLRLRAFPPNRAKEIEIRKP